LSSSHKASCSSLISTGLIGFWTNVLSHGSEGTILGKGFLFCRVRLSNPGYDDVIGPINLVLKKTIVQILLL